MYMVRWNSPRHLFLEIGDCDPKYAMLVNSKVVKFSVQRGMHSHFDGLDGHEYVGVGDRWLTKVKVWAKEIAAINGTKVEEVNDSLILI